MFVEEMFCTPLACVKLRSSFLYPYRGILIGQVCLWITSIVLELYITTWKLFWLLSRLRVFGCLSTDSYL